MRNQLMGLVLAASFMAVSCGKAPSSGEIVGKWTCPTLNNRTLEFRQDGTVTIENPMPNDVMIDEGDYTLNGNQLELNIKSMKRFQRDDKGAIFGSGQPEPPSNVPIKWKVTISGDSLNVQMGEGFGKTETFIFKKVQ